jgi:hypothetical protein
MLRGVSGDDACCYALRRLNPFLGVLQILETPHGKALSTNGVVWDIEPSAPADYQAEGPEAELAYYQYGLWSRDEGLVQRPLAALHGEDALKRQAEGLVQSVMKNLERLPFPLKDNRELWLFDERERRPLSLLASCLPDREPARPHGRRWVSSIGENGLASQRRYPAAGELETLVKERAGFNARTHWVTRDEQGGGTSDDGNIRLQAEDFPTLLITREWTETGQSMLVEGYLRWIAPSLLTLQHLNREQRAWLEQSLHLQAESVEHHWRLYPELVDERHLTSARVQCRMQRSTRN